MGAIGSIDWGFLEAFFGEYGKIITAVVALLVAAISLAIAVFRHRHARTLERILGRSAEDVRKDQLFLEKGKAALEQAASRLKQQEVEISQREQRLKDVRSAFNGKEHDLWCMHPARKPEEYDVRIRRQRQRPVIMVANLKGGVGKTTLTANLAAYFCNAGKRVLLVDVDYQGSLSNMMLSADGITEVTAEINKVLEADRHVSASMGAIRPFQNVLKGSSIIPAKYELAALENHLMIEHLMQDDGDDTRYRLAKLLLSEELAGSFDVALIDAPPRLTAGTINAFCASTHLLVPTLYDILSAEAVSTFLGGVQTMKGKLNHGIDLLGIVGMMTAQQGALNTRELNARMRAEKQVTQAWGVNHHFFDRHIPRKAAIAAAAGEDIAYYCDATVKGWFDELGNEIAKRLAWDSAASPTVRNPRVPELSQSAAAARQALVGAASR
jgi:chromosome partitioning protein